MSTLSVVRSTPTQKTAFDPFGADAAGRKVESRVVARGVLQRPALTAEAVARSVVFLLKMMPIPQKGWDRLTRRPLVAPRWFTVPGRCQADLYRPPSAGPHPAVLCVLGVVPAGVVHPMTRQLGEGLARGGFVALLHTSTAMRDLRLDPDDTRDLVSAYDALVRQPYVDPARSGLLGVCVGGSFALMCAADAAIRDRVRFVFAYAPYSSMWTFAVDIASGTRTLAEGSEPWEVDPLTWKTYVRSVTDWVPAADARLLRAAFEDRIAWNATKTTIVRTPAGQLDEAGLSDDGRAVLRVLRAGASDIESALAALPPAAKERMASMSPMSYLDRITAPRIMVLHDRFDHVIPVGESRRLRFALRGRDGVSYTELGLKHLRMPQGLTPLRLIREVVRTYFAWYPLFRETTA